MPPNSAFLLFLQVCWELAQVRVAGLLLPVVFVWSWPQEQGLRARGSWEPQVRLGLRWAGCWVALAVGSSPPALGLSRVGGRAGRILGLAVGLGPKGLPSWHWFWNWPVAQGPWSSEAWGPLVVWGKKWWRFVGRLEGRV